MIQSEGGYAMQQVSEFGAVVEKPLQNAKIRPTCPTVSLLKTHPERWQSPYELLQKIFKAFHISIDAFFNLNRMMWSTGWSSSPYARSYLTSLAISAGMPGQRSPCRGQPSTTIVLIVCSFIMARPTESPEKNKSPRRYVSGYENFFSRITSSPTGRYVTAVLLLWSRTATGEPWVCFKTKI